MPVCGVQILFQRFVDEGEQSRCLHQGQPLEQTAAPKTPPDGSLQRVRFGPAHVRMGGGQWMQAEECPTLGDSDDPGCTCHGAKEYGFRRRGLRTHVCVSACE